MTITQDGPFFARQRLSPRMIDPVEYDWPAEGWDKVVANGRVPLLYQRGPARRIVATQWQPTWNEFCKQHEERELTVTEGAKADGSTFDCVFDCTGPGQENMAVDTYHWFEFWEPDAFEKPDAAFTARKPQILISGSGDGALQDFLRVLFPGGKTPRDIYLEFNLGPQQKLKLEWNIFNAEDRARRAWVWSADPNIDCVVLRQLHEAHRQAALTLLPEVTTRLAEILSAAGAVTALDRLWLVHECTHFTPCYAFNRFLVLLIDEYCKTLPGVGTRLLDGRRLKKVVSTTSAHTCNGKPGECLLHRHQADFIQFKCATSSEVNAGSETYDVIVVRHGVEGKGRRLSRQALPYELPDLASF